jgi:uridine kinase
MAMSLYARPIHHLTLPGHSPCCSWPVQVDVPTYDFTRHCRAETTRRVDPADVIIVEGILVLHIEEIRQRLNMKVYVDTGE